MGFDTESEGETIPELGIDDAGDLFTGADVLSDAALGNWQQSAEEFANGEDSPLPTITLDQSADSQETNHDDVKVTDSRVREHRLLLGGLAFSLVLHFSLGGVLVSFEPAVHETVQPDYVSIRLLPVNPLQELTPELYPEQSPEPEEVLAESEVPASAKIEEVIEMIAEETPAELEDEFELPVEEAIGELVEVEISQTEESMSESEFSESQPVAEPPVIVIPSSDAVARSIQTVNAENTSRLWAYDCNARQEESELIRCDDQVTPDYDRVRENSTYRSLNPVRVLNRSQRTLSTVAENSEALAGRLQNIEIPEGLGEYLMEEVEAGITHNSNIGNQALQNINLMTDKSDAAQQARQVMSDPWVVNQSKKNAQRRVVPR